MGTNKKWYMSKTVWANVLSLLAIGLQAITGRELVSLELQVAALSVINLILRAITNENIEW